jgi:hypothetical protein
VETLLSTQDSLNVRDDLYNAEYYTATLSTGIFHDIHPVLIRRLESINRLLKSTKPGTEQYDMFCRDRDMLETATSVPRLIYEWYAVPYWIADYFLKQGEVVLIWQGLSSWGRTATGQFVYCDKAMRELFQFCADRNNHS